ILEDEDLAQQIHLHLQGIAKDGYVKAQDVVDIMATPEMKQYLGLKTGITLRTGQRWLHNMEWRYGKATKGMYIDGHERADVVEYRKGFLSRMNEYSKRMTTYDRDGNILSMPTGIDLAAGIYPLIKVTQDESTFTMYDRRQTKWDHEDAKQPEAKGEGPSLMVSGMLTEEWGELRHGDSESRVLFKAGKNRDGYFNNDNLVKQVDNAIDIFEEKTHGFKRALFLFDNATSHQKRAPDAPSARKMVKNPKRAWTHQPNGPKMRDTTLHDGTQQKFYFADDHPTMPGWFKGMQVILDER
ncbi:hypothetical protein DEU56DRAFT_703926, partial [Suillus clintonianus]|uniref:uncharacterized protein n=1 Tax=Suillus clintonianus TaxID=1904413 RepID=UPI001B85EE68